MTEHSVVSVGRPLLARGRSGLRLAPDERLEARLRPPGANDIVLTADAETAGIRLAAPEGPVATRSPLLWGRRPAEPSRRPSSAGPKTLRNVRTLLGGY